MTDTINNHPLMARIEEAWATEVATNVFDIWRWNTYAAESITQDIDLQRLGGLVVECSGSLWTPQDTSRTRRQGSFIVLAFEAPGRTTDTEHLLASAQDQLGNYDQLTLQLRKRVLKTDEHGPNETWILPDSALTVVDRV